MSELPPFASNFRYWADIWHTFFDACITTTAGKDIPSLESLQDMFDSYLIQHEAELRGALGVVSDLMKG